MVAIVAMFVLMCFCVTLCVAIAVDSEGWIIFTMMALMTLIGPYIYWVTSLDGITRNSQTNNIVWSAPVIGVLAAELAVIAIALGVTSWVHSRKTSFL